MGCHKVPTSKNPCKIGGSKAQLGSSAAFDIPSNFWYLSYRELQNIQSSLGFGLETSDTYFWPKNTYLCIAMNALQYITLIDCASAHFLVNARFLENRMHKLYWNIDMELMNQHQ